MHLRSVNRELVRHHVRQVRVCFILLCDVRASDPLAHQLQRTPRAVPFPNHACGLPSCTLRGYTPHSSAIQTHLLRYPRDECAERTRTRHRAHHAAATCDCAESSCSTRQRRCCATWPAGRRVGRREHDSTKHPMHHTRAAALRASPCPTSRREPASRAKRQIVLVLKHHTPPARRCNGRG
jgi:hypothetical protein